ncbi:Polymeric immunoglobulin receptor [Nibea albiflora]|nr:Polymeric immunoglobulin receptor [Nibea albiflora]
MTVREKETVLLLLLSLMTGCEAVSYVKGCRDGWVEFTCRYPEQNGEDNNITYSSIDVVKSGMKNIMQSSKINEWETTNGVSLYRDTNNKKVRVVIKKLKQQDFVEYQCEEQGTDFDTVKLDKDRDKGCQGPFIQTAYRTAKTTITCNYKGNRDEYDVLFFCKENDFTCEDILSTESSPKSNGTFTLTETNTGFSMSISEVSSLHAGVYWCGVKSNEGSYRAGFRKIQLEVEDITNFTRSPTIGQNFTYSCEYPRGAPIKKFICKGEDPSICEPLVNTMQRNKNTGRFSVEDDNKKRNITITVRDVTADDTGTYWCGAKSTDDKRSNPFFNRFLMTVGGSWAIIIVAVCAGVLLLVPLVLILIFIYKRITNFRRSPTIGQNFTYWCEYPSGAVRKKFICKGEDPSICEPLVNTMQRNKNTGRFSMEDDKNQKITITVRDVTADDTGTYWCGAKSTDDKHSNPFFQRLSMTVVQTSRPPAPPAQTPTPTPRVSSAQSTTTSTSAENNGGSWAIIIVVVCADVLLLVPLVLILSFIYKRCEAVSNVKGCRDGWVDFICKYRKTNNKKVRVVIKKLKQQDFGKYQCEEQGTDYDTVKLNNDRGCQEEFIQTAYRTAKTTITCNYKGNRDESNVLFFCKENKITCEEILSTESSPKSNGTFTLTKNNTGFNVSISEVSSLHAGVYWCGVKSNEGSYRAGFRKIQLDVEGITNFRRSPTIGQNFTYSCAYPNGAPIKKFICKGEDPSICEPLVITMQRNKNTGRFSMEDDKNKKITVTVRDVTADDTGTYWCGAKSTDEKHIQTSRPPPAPPAQTPTPTPRVSSAQSTTTSTSMENNGGSWGIIIVVVCADVLLLVPLVLILSFIYKRCEAVSNVKGCRDGWVDFTCKYRKSGFTLIKQGYKLIQSSKNNEWETANSVSLYRDTNNKKVRVVIKKLKKEDFAEYQCEEHRTDFNTVKLDKDRGCQGEFIQTAYRAAKTTITCNYKGNRDASDVLFFCKENKITCEEILSTESSPKSSGTFTLTETNTGFNVSISEVSSLHAGVYWCGVKSNEGSYRAGFRKIQLEVEDITNFTRSPTIGQNFTYWCEYPSGAVRKKFICKGEDPSICEPLVNTMQRNKNTGRFSMEDDKNQKITITVRDVTADDTGTYWCGAKSTDEKHSNPFFNRFSMTVGDIITATVCVGVLLVLFVLILIFIYKRCVASSEVKGCAGGWVEFTCGYEEDEYRKIVVEIPKGRPIEITEGGVWKQEGNISLYHDTKNKKFTVAIKQLQREDSGEYKYKFDLNENNSKEQEEENIKVEVEKDGCQGPFNQTAYRTAKTTITCNYKGKRDESDVLFFCKENNFTCEDILSTESSPKSSGTFTLTETNTGFNVSISEVSSLHAGVYWCGVKSNEGSYRAGFRKIQLEVEDITNFTRSPTIGQNFTYWCEYPNDDLINKFICKGEDPSICEPLVNTMQRNKNTGRFSMEDDNKKRKITITVRDVTADDTGTYWCGAKSTDDKHSNPFFNRLSMTVVPPTPNSPTTSSPTLTQPTTASHETDHTSVLNFAVSLSLDLLAFLLMVLVTYFLFKRKTALFNIKHLQSHSNRFQ